MNYPNESKTLASGHYGGKKLNEIWGYTTVGIAQTQAEMDAHLVNNKPSWGSSWSAGDIMYADLNGDGVINNGANTVDNPGDMRVIGNSTPRYNFGLTLDAAWKGIDFSVFFQGIGKRDYWLDGRISGEQTAVCGNLPDLQNIGISGVAKMMRSVLT